MKGLEFQISELIQEVEGITGKHIMIGSVESATGGRIGDRITNVPGSADYFKGAVVSYSNDVKTGIVGVKEETMKRHGAVSSQTAREMAAGGLKLLGLDYCVSTTGIAGPSGATPTKPVGLFYIGLATREGVRGRKHMFSGDREEIKQKATQSALLLLKNSLGRVRDRLKACGIVEKSVVTCFLQHKGKILVLRRSARVGTYKGAWAGISGYVETNPLAQAYVEIKEEAGLPRKSVELVASGKPLQVIDPGLCTRWTVHPFLFSVLAPDRIKTDWEHTQTRWIKPSALSGLTTVPGLKDALAAVHRR